MTIEEKIRSLLGEHGLWPEKHIEAVIERVKNHKILKSMSGRWNDNVDEYPIQIIAVLWLSIRKITVEYIDEVIPLAFYRSMFVD